MICDVLRLFLDLVYSWKFLADAYAMTEGLSKDQPKSVHVLCGV